MGKSAGVYNIPGELVQAEGEAMIYILTSICNMIWKTGEWPTTWTQPLLCQNYRTISLINRPSKVMLKIILNQVAYETYTLLPKQTPATSRRDHCRRADRFQSQMELHRTNIQSEDPLWEIPAASAESLPVFIDFKKVFDRVWHEA